MLHDNDSTPAAGVGVTVTPNMEGGCSAKQEMFTTNYTEWYSLSDLNAGSLLITVSYLRHDYNLTLQLGISDYNCETLYLPSVRTNATNSPTPCASTSNPMNFRTGYDGWQFEVQLNPTMVMLGQIVRYT